MLLCIARDPGVRLRDIAARVGITGPERRPPTGRDPAEVFVPQSHRPGAEAEADFGEVVVRLAGEQVKFFLLCFRLSCYSMPSCTARCRAVQRHPSKHGAKHGDGQSLKRQIHSVISLFAWLQGSCPGVQGSAEDRG
jgi:hypothetical protein